MSGLHWPAAGLVKTLIKCYMEAQDLVAKWLRLPLVNPIVLCSNLALGMHFVHLRLFTFYSSHEIKTKMVNSAAH